MNAPAPTGERYVRATTPVNVYFNKPLADRRRRREVMVGMLMGAMWRGGVLHHYRVAGQDGVFYLAPPHWFSPEQTAEFMGRAFPASSPKTTQDRIDELFDVLLAARQPDRDGVPA